MGVIFLLQGEMKPQSLVLWLQLLKLRTHGKYNRNKKVKYVLNIHVSDKFDI